MNFKMMATVSIAYVLTVFLDWGVESGKDIFYCKKQHLSLHKSTF